MNRILLLAVLIPLLVSGCVASPQIPATSPTPATEATSTESVASLLADWENGVAASDEIGLYVVTLKLPHAVEVECRPTLTDDVYAFTEEFAAEATAEVEQVTAETGGANAFDIFKAWTGYMKLIRDVC